MGAYRILQEALDQQLSNLAQLAELKGSNLPRLLDKLRQNRWSRAYPKSSRRKRNYWR